MGKLVVDNLPWTQPAFAPLFSADAFPVITRERWQVSLAYESPDYEFVDSLLPEGVNPAADPVVCSVWSATHAHSTMGGPYRESGAGVVVTYEGDLYFYPFVVYLGDNTEEWFAAGREVWGHQKKLGKTTLTEPEGNGIVTGRLERPLGSTLMEISVGPLEREARPDEIGFLPVMSLRVIPHPERGTAQTAELILTQAELTPRRGSDGRIDFWAGPGQVAFPIPSDRDPLHRLRVGRVISGYYGCFEGIVTPFGKILKKII